MASKTPAASIVGDTNIPPSGSRMAAAALSWVCGRPAAIPNQAFPAAIRLYHSSDIHLRNVHINGESGFSVCDDKGCGTFLRAGRYPYENAIQDITRGIETREREFAALDITADAAMPPAGY